MENEKTIEGVKEKKLTPTEQNSKDIKDLKEEFAGLSSKLDQLIGILAATKKEEAKEPVKAEVKEDKQAEIMSNPNKYKFNTTDEISFVHLVQRAEGLSTYVKLTTTELNLSMAGEVFQLTRLQADEFVGKYRKWFDDGIFAVYNDDISIRYAEVKKIKPASFYEFSKHNLNTIGDLNYADFESLIEKLAPAHKDNVIQYFKQKVYEASAMPEKRDPRFCDLRKLEILNRLSGCDSLKYEIEDLKKVK